MSKKDAAPMPEAVISKNLEAAQKEFEAFKEKFGVDLQVGIDFPRYRELPDELQLALRIFYKENPQFLISLVEKPQEDESAQ